MDTATLDAWNRGAYAKCLADARTTREAMADNARLLWASAFGTAETWFDPEPIDYHTRPTECEAISGIFRQARGAANLWVEWQTARELLLYGDELDALARAVETMREKNEAAARKAEVRAIRRSQMQLPAPFAVAV